MVSARKNSTKLASLEVIDKIIFEIDKNDISFISRPF